MDKEGKGGAAGYIAPEACLMSWRGLSVENVVSER